MLGSGTSSRNTLARGIGEAVGGTSSAATSPTFAACSRISPSCARSWAFSSSVSCEPGELRDVLDVDLDRHGGQSSRRRVRRRAAGGSRSAAVDGSRQQLPPAGPAVLDRGHQRQRLVDRPVGRQPDRGPSTSPRATSGPAARAAARSPATRRRRRAPARAPRTRSSPGARTRGGPRRRRRARRSQVAGVQMHAHATPRFVEPLGADDQDAGRLTGSTDVAPLALGRVQRRQQPVREVALGARVRGRHRVPHRVLPHHVRLAGERLGRRACPARRDRPVARVGGDVDRPRRRCRPAGRSRRRRRRSSRRQASRCAVAPSRSRSRPRRSVRHLEEGLRGDGSDAGARPTGPAAGRERSATARRCRARPVCGSLATLEYVTSPSRLEELLPRRRPRRRARPPWS